MARVFLLLCVFGVFLLAAVNINTANVSELATLKGIGDKKAQAIVDYREANGKFKTTQDLVGVKGIGEKIIINLKDEITVK